MVIQVGKRRAIRLNNKLKHLFNNNWLEIACRWILGITFIYASYYKILSPADFATVVYGYNLFPEISINLIAIILPYVELISGLSLILGVYPRSATLIINGLLVAFIVVLTINLIRGHEFDCGCFSPHETGHETSPTRMVGRDVIYLLLGLQVFLFGGERKLCLVP